MDFISLIVVPSFLKLLFIQVVDRVDIKPPPVLWHEDGGAQHLPGRNRCVRLFILSFYVNKH